jgi:pyruvate kinase
LPHPDLVADVQPGQRLLLDDGALELQIESKTEADLVCRVIVGGRLSSHKGVSAPGAALSLSSLTDKDRADAQFAVEQSADYIALSFVRRAADVSGLRALLASRGAHVPIVAKIEKAEALDAFDEILQAADAVMVARGDLGVETPAEYVPIHQKRILRACNCAGKPAITATQMLQSMMDNPRPTRAEASDVANAVLDGSDAVMLSGETATGHYPVEAVQVMERVATIAEEHLDCGEWLRRVNEANVPSEAIARATVEIAMDLKAAAIITSTMSGHTAQMVARYRPCVPVLAATPDQAVYRRMALVWGVVPLLVPEYASTDEMIETTTRAAYQAGLVKPGECVVITAGIPAGGEGKTNMLKVHVI